MTWDDRDFEPLDPELDRRRHERRLAMRAAELDRLQREHDREAAPLEAHVLGIGKWGRPLGGILVVMVMGSTSVLSVMGDQYLPILVMTGVCALGWWLCGRLWHSFAKLVVWLNHGSRPTRVKTGRYQGVLPDDYRGRRR
ncbi:hypothetical protein [Brachybacterium hainanense]|uniref:DUF3040 domain-containing protein n=1 Tax=Brachybacterium hainanense TaxID=1541174 RepID=A0ABV6RC03_9MICO